LNTQTAEQVYNGKLLADCRAAMDDRPEVAINSPGHEYHGRKVRFIATLLDASRAMVHVEDDIYVTLDTACIQVTPEAQPCL
jgi:hypothetical protein